MRKLLLSEITLIFSLLWCTTAFALNTWQGTPEQLAQSLVGPGVTISNISYTGSEGAVGFFNGGLAAGIGIEKGIVLTSGSISNLNGTSNTSDEITTANGKEGALFLNALIPGFSTYDAAILEFDFLSKGNEAYFSYVFGSEEYNEYVNDDYNDVFGFFLDGTAVTNNMAVLTDGSVVSINNINNSNHPELYNNNDPSDTGNPTPFPFEYDGFTDVLTVSMTGLGVNTTHHMILAIADSGDENLDSGVFIAAGTFSNIPTASVPEPSLILLTSLGLIAILTFRGFILTNKKNGSCRETIF